MAKIESAEFLGKIDPGNTLAIDSLINMISTTDIRKDEVTKNLKAIISYSHLQHIIKKIKPYLLETYETDRDLFNSYYEIAWHCAENLSYPEFYQAWHNESYFEHLKPKILKGRLLVILFSYWARCYTYLSLRRESPKYVLWDVARLTVFLLRCLLYAIGIICFPLILVIKLISYLSKRYLGADLIVKFFELLGAVIGFIVGIGVGFILGIGVPLLMISIPIYLIYRLLAWIFGW